MADLGCGQPCARASPRAPDYPGTAGGAVGRSFDLDHRALPVTLVYAVAFQASAYRAYASVYPAAWARLVYAEAAYQLAKAFQLISH